MLKRKFVGGYMPEPKKRRFDNDIDSMESDMDIEPLIQPIQPIQPINNIKQNNEETDDSQDLKEQIKIIEKKIDSVISILQMYIARMSEKESMSKNDTWQSSYIS